jgi:hypothetical protein
MLRDLMKAELLKETRRLKGKENPDRPAIKSSAAMREQWHNGRFQLHSKVDTWDVTPMKGIRPES